MVHFIMDAVKALDLSQAHTNQRGTGNARYPPSMMLGLLIYSYSADHKLDGGLTGLPVALLIGNLGFQVGCD